MTQPSNRNRRRSDPMDSQPFRIFSLDGGGGIMGAFAASALATFKQATGRRIVDHFDLITGTSTGGIIAIGLATLAGSGRYGEGCFRSLSLVLAARPASRAKGRKDPSP